MGKVMGAACDNSLQRIRRTASIITLKSWSPGLVSIQKSLHIEAPIWTNSSPHLLSLLVISIKSLIKMSLLFVNVLQNVKNALTMPSGFLLRHIFVDWITAGRYLNQWRLNCHLVSGIWHVCRSNFHIQQIWKPGVFGICLYQSIKSWFNPA
jgi:hypothetical protein